MVYNYVVRRVFFEEQSLTERTLELISRTPMTRIKTLEGNISAVEYNSISGKPDNISSHFGVVYTMGSVRESKPIAETNQHYFVFIPADKVPSFPNGLVFTDTGFFSRERQLGLNDYRKIKVISVNRGPRTDYLRRIFDSFHENVKDELTFVIYDRKGRLIIEKPQSPLSAPKYESIIPDTSKEMDSKRRNFVYRTRAYHSQKPSLRNH